MIGVVSLFSGVGGFDVGFENAGGYRTVFQSEIDRRCLSVLRRHFPDTDRWGDITTLTGQHIVETLTARNRTPDVIVWGSPCQDLSVAGRRAGLDGERSGLFHHGIRIINEIRRATDGRYPRVSVWENVAGALNSNRGADFGRVIDEMAAAGAMVIEWRMLDAQYFGVPQRRRRVFVVAIFDPATAERCPDPLLPVEEGVRGDTAPGAAARQDAAAETAQSVADGDEHQRIVGPVTTRMSSPRGTETSDSEHLVIEAYGESSFAQYRQGFSTLKVSGGCVGGGSETLLVDGTRVGDVRVYHEPVQTLKERMGTGRNNVPMVALPIGFSHTQGLSALPSQDAFPTLRREGSGMTVAYSFDAMGSNSMKSSNPHSGVRAVDVSTTLDTARPDPSCNQGGIGIVEPTMTVRRLTPLECERLMGWADDWTRFDDTGREMSDTTRYKMCGNGVAAPVAEWIGRILLPLLTD